MDPIPTSPAAAAQEFVGIYAAMLHYIRRGPPQVFAQAISQAMSTMAPLAVEALLIERQAKPVAAPDAPEESKD